MRAKTSNEPKEMLDIPHLFTKPNTISKHMQCVICLEVFRQPWHLACGHTFCKKCIEGWQHSNGTCPECRVCINEVFMDPDLLAQAILSECEVACPKEKCAWTGQLQHLEKHYLIDCHFKTDTQLKEDINADADKDDQLVQRINKNVPMGSLLGRVLNNRLDISQKLQEASTVELIQKDQTLDFLDQLLSQSL